MTFMEILIWVVGIVLGIPMLFMLVAFLIGRTLPATHTATRKLALKKPVEEVWGFLTDCVKHPAWRNELKSIERLADREGNQVWREVPKAGSPMTLESVEWLPPRRWVRRIVDENGPFTGKWEIDLAPSADNTGCTVQITEIGTVQNPIFRFVSKYIMGHVKYLEMFLKELAAGLSEPANFVG